MANKQTIHLQLEFDGTNYAGWLVQPNGQTVQEVLQGVISKVFQEDVKLVGCSRTDSGVHARDYHAHFQVNRLSVPLENIPMALNGLLPEDIVVNSATLEEGDFHATFSAKLKTYRYTLIRSRYLSPFDRLCAASTYDSLNVDAMKEATKHFVGELDFRAFCCEPERKENHVRRVTAMTITEEGDSLLIDSFRYGERMAIL